MEWFMIKERKVSPIVVLLCIVVFSLFGSICLFLLKKCGTNDRPIEIVGADGTKYQNYQAVCRALDFEAAHEYLDILHNEYSTSIGKDPSHWDYSSEEANLRVTYFSAVDYIYTQEIAYISSLDDFDPSDKLLFLIREFPFAGQCPSEGIANVGAGGLNNSFEGRNITAYKNSVTLYTKICNAALDVALNRKDKKLAEKIISLLKPNIDITRGNGLFFGDVQVDGVDITSHEVYIKYNYSDIEEARKKIDSENNYVKNGKPNRKKGNR